jgi:hypothetical protein
MDEPTRIGLTAEAGSQLEELLDELNPDKGVEGVKLIKFDLYRLAVALGLKKSELPPPFTGNSTSSLRVNELDPDGVLYLAAEHSELLPDDTSVYGFVERLAEAGVRDFYTSYQTTGQLPFDQYFDE